MTASLFYKVLCKEFMGRDRSFLGGWCMFADTSVSGLYKYRDIVQPFGVGFSYGLSPGRPPSRGVCVSLVPFGCRGVFHCVDAPRLNHPSIEEHLGCFRFWTHTQAAVNALRALACRHCHPSGYTPTARSAGTWRRHVQFRRGCRAVFQSGSAVFMPTCETRATRLLRPHGRSVVSSSLLLPLGQV